MSEVLVACTDQRVRAGSKKWHEVRQSGIGASEIAYALGIGNPNWSSPYSLYARKRGELPDDDRDNVSMEWGRELEGVILKRFLRGHPEFREGPCITGRLYRSNDRPWQLATPDAVVFDRRLGFTYDKHPVPRTREGFPVIVEVKTGHPTEGWGQEGSDDIPVYYRAQVLQNMDVVGAIAAWVPVLFNGRDYREYRVSRDEGDIAIMRLRGAQFWQRIVDGNPPPVDGLAPTTKALAASRLNPEAQVQVAADLVRKIERAKALQKRVKKLRDRLENELRQEMGEAGVAMSGAAIVARRSTYTQRRIALDDLRAGHPDIAEEYTTTETVRRLYTTTKELS